MNEKTYTERDVILRERQAYENGMVRGSAREFSGQVGGMDRLRAAVRAAFPLPKVTRPRVVTIRGWEYRIDNGYVESRYGPGAAWIVINGVFAVDVLSDLRFLLANPTETVDADD